MSDIIAFVALMSLINGPIFVVLAILEPSISSASPENDSSGVMQIIFAVFGLGELVAGIVLLSWRRRLVKDVFDHGVEVKSRVSSYAQDTGTVIFDYTFQGENRKVPKHVFGQKTFPKPKEGQEVILIVHQEKPESFVIKDQYL